METEELDQILAELEDLASKARRLKHRHQHNFSKWCYHKGVLEGLERAIMLLRTEG